MKKSKNNFLILILLLTNILMLGMSSSLELLPNNSDETSNLTGDESELQTTPLNSDIDFLEANKTITRGVQVDPPFNETNIMFDDDIYDFTKFENGSTYTNSYHDATNFDQVTGIWGAGTGGEGQYNTGGIAPALATLDGNQFWLLAYMGLIYPFPYPIISLGCKGFSHINDPDIIPHIYQVQIKYDILTLYRFDSGLSINLKLVIYTKNGVQKEFLIDFQPRQSELNSGTFVINDEEFINLVKNGDYVNSIAVKLNCLWETSDFVYIGIDCMQIKYIYKTYDVDFIYKLNYAGHDLSTIEEFGVEFDINGTIDKPELTKVYLYNFNTTNWDFLGNVLTEGLWTKTVNINASAYFNHDNNLLVNFRNYMYTEDSPPSNYSIGIDFVKIIFKVPNKPLYFYAKSGISHIMLTWDIAYSFGVPIDHYNIYRGVVMGSNKELYATSITNEFNDTGAVIGTRYYYVVSAENSIGESENSSERTAMAYNAPFIEWKSPIDKDTVIFGTGLAYFNFTFDRAGIDEATLEIDGRNYGSVINKTCVIIFPYNDTTDGNVNATIHGYREDLEVANETIRCFFSKLTSDELELLSADTQYVGQKLYLIMHDPSGDNSYSYYEQQTLFSMAVGFEISELEAQKDTIGEIMSISAGEIVSGGIDVGGTSALQQEAETIQGFDFRYDFVDVSSITSSIDSTNKNFIGPGYGDIYWGEAWTLDWKLYAYHRTYWNGTIRYEETDLSYGIIRKAEVLLTDNEAPEEWRALNPVHNGWQNVTWFPDKANVIVCGNTPRTRSTEVTMCNTFQQTVIITISQEAYMKLPGFAQTMTMELKTKMYRETTVSASYTIGYTINDDESTDLLVQDIGIDNIFGTYIFRTNSSVTKTSYPLEHNTIDYLPPIIEFPNIRLDSSQDGEGPCMDDSPIITVDIFDEGGIRSALIFYSITNGTNWVTASLSEQFANLGTWQGSIPSYPHGTAVLWYIKVWDFSSCVSNRTDPNGKPYKYYIKNRNPYVKILNPNGGEVFQDFVMINWTGSDPDDDDLSYSVAYNIENMGWHLLKSDLNQGYYQWNVTQFGSENVMLKVIATDGENQGEDETDYVFTIQSPLHAPLLNIHEDIQYIIGSTGNVIEWTILDENLANYRIYKDGKLLYSGEFDEFRTASDDQTLINVNVDGLELGTYLFLIEVEDHSGYTVSDEVTVIVNDNPEISSIVKGTKLRWVIKDVSYLSCEYIITRDDIEIDAGEWIPNVPVETNFGKLAPGSYLFELYATDGLGGRAANVVIIKILEPQKEFPFLFITIILSVVGVAVAISTYFGLRLLKQRKIKG